MSARAGEAPSALRAAALRGLAFALAFACDVRARAGALPDAAQPLQQPSACLEGDAGSPCVVGTRAGERLLLPMASGELVVDRDSSAARLGPGRAILLKGGAWARARGKVAIATEFGSVAIDSGEAWVWREGGRVWIDALAGSVALEPRGSPALKVALLPGMRNWLGPVGPKGLAELGFPRALDFAERLRLWASLYRGSQKDFTGRAEQLAESWREAIREVASLDEARARARLQALADEDARRQARAAAIEARNRGLRALFLRKAYE
jgi:hypothetical protein